MSLKTFGLDIGTTSLKAALIKKNGAAFSIESIAVAPATSKGVLSESLADQQFLAEQIKQMLASAGIKLSDVNISVPDSQVYTKVIEMPQLSDQELSAALKFQMEQYVPLPIDQVRTDWQILGKTERDGKKLMNVMIVAAPFTILEKYEKILSMAGLVPVAIETEIISVHRALLPLIGVSNSSIVIHIGASTTDVAIIKGGIINMVFSIGLGGLAITRAISLDLGIDIAQAENFKKAYGLNQDAFEGKIGKSLSPILDSITGDIRKAILLFKEKNNSDEIKQIVLSGGSALLPGIDVYLTNTFGIQVVFGSCWEGYSISNVPEQVMVDSPSYNVVVGLALRDVA